MRKPTPGHDQGHHHGKRIETVFPGDVQCSQSPVGQHHIHSRDPGEEPRGLDGRASARPKDPEEAGEGEKEREADAAAGYRRDESLGQPIAEESVNERPDAGQKRNKPEKFTHDVLL